MSCEPCSQGNSGHGLWDSIKIMSVKKDTAEEALAILIAKEMEAEKLGKLLWQFIQLYWERMETENKVHFIDIATYVERVSEGLNAKEVRKLEKNIFTWLLGRVVSIEADDYFAMSSKRE